MSWDDIADPDKGGVVNLQCKPTCRDVVRRAYSSFFKPGRGKGKYDYNKCASPGKGKYDYNKCASPKLHTPR